MPIILIGFSLLVFRTEFKKQGIIKAFIFRALKMTYADEWMNYPNMKFKPENARPVTNAEWKHEGGDQWGYMMWYFSHLPHFKGLNTIDPNDLHLNNWWHYVVNYNEALEKEAELRALYEGGLYTMPY